MTSLPNLKKIGPIVSEKSRGQRIAGGWIFFYLFAIWILRIMKRKMSTFEGGLHFFFLVDYKGSLLKIIDQNQIQDKINWPFKYNKGCCG